MVRGATNHGVGLRLYFVQQTWIFDAAVFENRQPVTEAKFII